MLIMNSANNSSYYAKSRNGLNNTISISTSKHHILPKLNLKFSQDSNDFIKSGSDEDYKGHYPSPPSKSLKIDNGHYPIPPNNCFKIDNIPSKKSIKIDQRHDAYPGSQVVHDKKAPEPMKTYKRHKSASKNFKRHAKEYRRGSDADSDTDMSTSHVVTRPPRKPHRNYKDYYDPETQKIGKDPRSFHREKRKTRAHVLSRAELLLDRRKSYPYTKSDTERSSPLPELSTFRSVSLGIPSPIPFGHSNLTTDGYKPLIFPEETKTMNSNLIVPSSFTQYQQNQSKYSFQGSGIKHHQPKQYTSQRYSNAPTQPLKSNVYNYDNTSFVIKDNNSKQIPNKPNVGILTMNALWNLRKEEQADNSNIVYNQPITRDIVSLAGHWNDIQQPAIETLRSSDTFSLKDNSVKGRGLKSFRTMQNLRNQRRHETDYETNGSSQCLSDDEDDDDRGFDSEVIYTSNELPMNQGRRYEESLLIDKQYENKEVKPKDDLGKKGRRVIFFRNGDSNYKGKEVLINQRNFANFEKLLIELSDTIPTPTGVKFIFNFPQGKEMKSLLELENGQIYIVSSVNKLNKSITYGQSRENYWQNSKLNHNDLHLFKGQNYKSESGGTNSASSKQPLKVTIIGNLKRDSKYIMLLNPQTERNFEDILEDIPQMVHIQEPPVQSLWTAKKPLEKVESFSSLLSLLKNNHTEFFAVGQEGVPMEMDTKRRQLPISESEESLNDKRKQANGGKTPTLDRKGGDKQRWTETARITINGKPKELFAPSIPDPDDDGKKPNKKLKLDWVYGFRGRDVRNNLVVLVSGELVYFVATVVVIYEKRDPRYVERQQKHHLDRQRHYTGHTEEVTSLTLHPNQRYIASGQLAGKSAEFAAHVRIWDGITLTTYQVIGLDVFRGGVNNVSFSTESEGELLMVIDDSDKHVLSVWDWQKPKLIAKTTTTTEAVTAGEFYPLDDDIIITYGRQHLFFWKLFWDPSADRGAGKVLRDKQSGIFQDEPPKNVTAMSFTSVGDVVTGDSNGSIIIWSRGDKDIFNVNHMLSNKMVNAHKKPIYSLYMMDDGTLMSGGGNEVKAWDSQNSYKLVKERLIPELAGAIRAIIPQNAGGQDGNLYVATTKSCVLQGSMLHKFQFVIQGNSEEVWAIASHPRQPSFITAGHDQLVMKWSTVSHNIQWRTQIERPCVSVTVDPKGQLVAVGTTVGRLVILRADDGDEVSSTQVGIAQINAVSFSPDSSMLAIGSHDGFIHVFTMNESGQFFKTQSAALKNNNAFVSQVDWSCDGRFLQTVLGDYEIVYWDIENMQKMKNPRIMRDCDWITQTCSVGHSLVGPWSNLAAKEVINVASRSISREFLVCGDNRGNIRLYKYPSSTVGAQYRTLKAYSNNVTAVAFTADDSYVISSGGNDAALFQWSLSGLNSH